MATSLFPSDIVEEYSGIPSASAMYNCNKSS